MGQTLGFLIDNLCYSHRRSQGVAGDAVAPPRATTKILSRHFCWNEAKTGLDLVRCTPADEIKGSLWQYMTYMTTYERG